MGVEMKEAKEKNHIQNMNKNNDSFTILRKICIHCWECE